MRRSIIVAGLLLGNAACIDVQEDTARAQEEIRGGYEVVGHNGMVEINGCTGWMLSPRVIVTAAHCLPATAGESYHRIDYFRPETGKELIWSDDIYTERHPGYEPGDPDHDIGFVLTPDDRWLDTGYLDYLRVYPTERGLYFNIVEIWGIGYNTHSGNGFGTLRHHDFIVEFQGTDDNVLRTTAANDFSLCHGDSGGPVIKELPDPDAGDPFELVVGTHSTSQKIGDEECAGTVRPIWQADQEHSRMNPGHVSWLASRAGLDCASLTAYGLDYLRCFEIPFINVVEEEGLPRSHATAIVHAAL